MVSSFAAAAAAASVLLTARHREARSRYRARQEGTSGCSPETLMAIAFPRL